MPGSSEHQPLRRRWPWVVAGLAGIAVVSVAAYAGEEQDESLAALEATSVDASTLPQTLPFRFVAGHLLMDALPEGSTEPIDFILDSGAPTTYSDRTADAHGGEAVGQVREQAIDGSVLDVPVISIETLAIGDAVFKDVAGSQNWVAPDNPLSCLSDNGLIGANLMKNAVWQIDYANEEVTIASSADGLDHIDDAIALEFTFTSIASPSPLVRFGAGDGELVFLLDTGSDGGLSVNPADLEAIGMTVDPDGPAADVLGAGIAGTFETALTYAGVDLDIGGTAAEAYPVATLPTLAEGQGNIGNEFLDDFVVTIDWPNETLYLDPVTGDGSIPTPAVPAQATLSWDGEDIVVGSLARESAVAQSGLTLGSVVENVDGVDYGEASRDDFCALFTGETPARFAVTTADGESYEVGPADGFYDSLDR